MKTTRGRDATVRRGRRAVASAAPRSSALRSVSDSRVVRSMTLSGLQTARTLEKRLDHLRDALLVDGRANVVCDREHALVRIGDGDAVPRPLEQLDVVLSVAERHRRLSREAEALGDELEPGRFRH